MRHRSRALSIAAAAVVVVSATAVVSVAAETPPTGALTVEPAIVQKTTATGTIGAVTVLNGTSRAMRITVTPRPWLQSSSGSVTPNAKKSLATVRASATSFTLPAGQTREVLLALTKLPKAGSLYGSIEVLGTPQGPQPKHQVKVRYRLISALRLQPSSKARRFSLQPGALRVQGKGSKARPVLSVRNRGNTIEPVSGQAQIKGATGTLRSSITAIRILPAATVQLPLGNTRLQPGRYTATITLKQDGHQAARIVRRFRVP